MSSKEKRLFGNVGALLILQIASYILPFLLIPYLTRTLGVNLYGVVAFGLSAVQVACILTDFGFGLSATHKIAKHQGEPQKIRAIANSVFVCKSALFIITLLLLWIVIEVVDTYKAHETFFWLLLLPIAGQTLQPIWFFQGIERMGYITAYSVLSKASYVFLVLALVKGPADLKFVAISYGIAQIIAALLGIGLMMNLGYRFKWPGLGSSWRIFKESAEFFWSRAAVATYTVGGTFFLGITSSPAQVAYYSAAEQMYRGAQALFQPISQALYPYMTKTRDIVTFKKILVTIVSASFICSAIGLLISEKVIYFIFGPGFSETTPILNIFLITFMITVPSTLLGYPLLGALGDSKSANLSVLYAGIIQAIVLLVIYYLFPKEGIYVAASVILSEVFVLIYRSSKSRTILKKQKQKKTSNII